MTPARKPLTKLKSRAQEQPRRAKSRLHKKPFITRAGARRRAERHVLAGIFKGARVRDGAEVRLGIYLREDYTANDVWVAYKNSEAFGLKSSDVVLVSKRTDRVLYEGSASDEG